MATFSDGLYLVLKRECPTCSMIEPVVRALAADDDRKINQILCPG